jgi:hypothetical protein
MEAFDRMTALGPRDPVKRVFGEYEHGREAAAPLRHASVRRAVTVRALSGRHFG